MKPKLDWERLLLEGFTEMLAAVHGNGQEPDDYMEHTEETPKRVVKAYREFFHGAQLDPGEVLRRSFKEGRYNQMITMLDLDVTSFCNHHLLPFVGKAHFAYIPEGRIVGLSKVPRFIDILAARPQVQERLSEQIVDVFCQEIQPRGCAVVLDCLHTCMSVRGVKKRGITRTTSLRGVFNEEAVRSEFLSAIGRAQL